MDGLDRVIAIIFTLMAIGMIAVAITVLVASLIASPVGTIIIIVVTVWLFRKIYPHVVQFMKKEGF